MTPPLLTLLKKTTKFESTVTPNLDLSRWLGIGHIFCGIVALLIDLAKLLMAGDDLHWIDGDDDD